MKYTRKHKDEYRYISEEKDRILQLIKYCEWKNCDNKGIYKAPKNRLFLREFHWFCLEHVKLYNSQWDYFSGSSQKEIEKEVREDMTWHRPTWPMGVNNNIFNIKLNDPYTVFKNKKFKSSNENNINRESNIKITNAFTVLELKMNSSLPEVKRRYKTLVKKYHPDANKGEKNTSDRLIKINAAYSFLLKKLS